MIFLAMILAASWAAIRVVIARPTIWGVVLGAVAGVAAGIVAGVVVGLIYKDMAGPISGGTTAGQMAMAWVLAGIKYAAIFAIGSAIAAYRKHRTPVG